MENKNHNSIYHDDHIVVDKNPLSSKLLTATMLQFMSGEEPSPDVAFKVVDESIDKFYEGVELNAFDVPCYIMALDIMKQSLLTLCNEEDMRLYEFLKKHCSVTTLHIDHTQEDDDNENS